MEFRPCVRTLDDVFVLIIIVPLLLFLSVLSRADVLESLDDNLYLVQLNTDTYTLADNVPVYKVKETFYINFSEFIGATGFAVTHAGDRWQGWCFSEEQGFELSPSLNQVSIDGKPEPIDPGDWFNLDDELYLSMKLLRRWFEMEFTVNEQQQSMDLEFAQPLPFQLSEEQSKRKNRYRHPGNNVPDALIDDQYQWFTTPRFDLGFNEIYNHNDGLNSDATSLSYTAGLDMLKHSVLLVGAVSRGSESGTNSTSRITFERRALNHVDNLFLGVDRYRFGDVFANNTTLVNRGGSGVGFFLERGDNLRAQTQGKMTISGDAQPGWELELYQNGALIEFGRVGVDGRYIFLDQEVFQGENRFVVKIYGPQGQVREQVQTKWGGGAELPAGEYAYSISYQDFTRSLLDGEFEKTSGLPASDLVNVGVSYAISDDVQLGVNYNRAGLNTRENRGEFKQQDYYSFNGRFALSRGLILADVVAQGSGQAAWEIRYLGSFYGQDLSFSHQKTRGFESPFTLNSTKLDSSDILTLSGAIQSTWLKSYLLRTTYERRSAGGSDLVLFNRMGLRLGRLNLTNEYEYRALRQGSGSQRGLLRFSGRRRNHNLSGLINYRLAQSRPVDQVSALWRWHVNRDTFNSVQVSKSLKGQKTLVVTNRFTRMLGNFAVTLFGSWTSRSDWSAGLSLDIAIGYNPSSRDVYTNKIGLANYGRLTMSPFLDANDNGFMDPDESVLEGFTHRHQDFATTGTGQVTHNSVPAYMPFLIHTDQIKVDDPFLVAKHKLYGVDTHPGAELQVEIPFVLTGDIEGNVHVLSDGKEQGLARVEIGLYDSAGKLVDNTKSQFDGYFSFSQIPVGEYELHFSVGEISESRQAILDADKGYVVLDPVIFNKSDF